MSARITSTESEALERFPAVAADFCGLIDDFGRLGRAQLVRELSVHIARLFEVAMFLPSVEPATENLEDYTSESLPAHTKEWANLSDNLRRVFEPYDTYWEVFDPTTREEPVSCSLAIDVAEIYQDLRDALNLQNSGAAENDIHWQWHFDFHQHWGRHASGALRALLHISNFA